LTLSFNAPSALDPFFTSYLYDVDTGFIMTGTTTHPPNALRFGGMLGQKGAPYSASSFGSGGAFVTYPSFSPTSPGIVGKFNFSGGLNNFSGTLDFSRGGAFNGPQAFTGSLTSPDPNSGRFTGTLNFTGFPSGAGSLTGYMYWSGEATFIMNAGGNVAVAVKYNF